MSESIKPPETKRVAAKHLDLIAAAEVYDILDALPEAERTRVVGWVNAKYSVPKTGTIIADTHADKRGQLGCPAEPKKE